MRACLSAGLLCTAALLALAAGCSYRPARFADRLPVSVVRDTRPIPPPEPHSVVKEVYQADVYVRRELVRGLDPTRTPDAADVNSLDEVPRSSWFCPRPNPFAPLGGYAREGPPVPPLAVLEEPPVSGPHEATVVRDGRGLRYELREDVPGREGMRTGAAAIASRLVYALGYHTPEVWIARSPAGRRASALRWPMGVDLGPTPMHTTRSDDANDVVAHVDRRSLRAMQVVAAWLNMARLDPWLFRDAYVGEPGRGHVQHALVGLDGAIGVDALLQAKADAEDPDTESKNFFFRLFGLGLSPKPPRFAPRSPWPAVGLISDIVSVEHFSPSPPFTPIDRLLPADVYWAAKRIAAIPDETVDEAVAAGELRPPEAGAWLARVLKERRDRVALHGLRLTTACEVLGIEGPEGPEPTLRGGPSYLVLTDLLVSRGYVPPRETLYRVDVLDDEGEVVAGPANIRPAAGIFRVVLPAALRELGYVVVRVLASRQGRPAPSAFEAHLHADPEYPFWRLLGLRP
ncbi:MAG: hypothetical protein HY744_24695 [Deltaproteobacteria bacterium]|nr:hypothetical protein [Deltaproteobacteria bacterium]